MDGVINYRVASALVGVIIPAFCGMDSGDFISWSLTRLRLESSYEVARGVDSAGLGGKKEKKSKLQTPVNELRPSLPLHPRRRPASRGGVYPIYGRHNAP